MNRYALSLAFLALPGFAQVAAPAARPKPAAKAAAKPAPARARAVEELKFPPLGNVKIPDIVTFTLPNGMKVFLLENHELPLISGSALMRGGEIRDPADKVGLAETMATVLRTGGTKQKTGDQLDEELENAAASVESGAGDTSFSLSFNCLKENTAEVMAVFHDLLTAPEFRQDKLDLAKTQLKSAIQRRNDDASGIASREFEELLYGKDSPWARRAEYETIDRIERADLIGHHRRYYFPANILLSVYGDFNATEMRASLEKMFAGWTVAQPPVPPQPEVSAAPAPGVFLAAKNDVNQTNFRVGHLGGMYKDKDYPALEVMGDVLGGGSTGRLFRRIRSELGYAYAIRGSWSANYSYPGRFIVSGSTKSESTADTLLAIREEIGKIRAAEVTDEELATAKDSILNSFVFNFESPRSTLSRLVTYEFNGYPKTFLFDYQKAVAAVTKADVLRVAKQYLKPENLTYVAVGKPADFGKPLTALNLPVKNIDLTIPEPKQQQAAATPETLARGRQLLAALQQAAGGADRIAGVKDYMHTVAVELQTGASSLKVQQTTKIVGQRLRQEQQLPFGKVVVYFDGTGGWMFAPTPQGPKEQPLPAPAIGQVKGELFRFFATLWLSDRDPERTVNSPAPGVLEIADKQGNATRLTLDEKTGLPLKQTYRQGPLELEETYSDWKDAGGVKLPHKVVVTRGGQKAAESAYSEIRINSGIQPEEIGQKP